jgi:Zn finger protein HypA/HybF involved in hydrogenase expression
MVEDRTALETGDTADNSRAESATLYRCPACETTYIATGKERCSQCDGDVREIPSGADLGIESTGR